MKMLSASVVLLLTLFAIGCGSSATEPAKPEDTPVISQQELEERMTKNVPPEAQKMYQKYKKGGS